jgi:hypothetical protein
MPIHSYKTLPEKYDTILSFVGLFIPVPSSQCKYTPDFVIADWGFGASIGVCKVPLGIIMIIVAVIVKLI